MKQIDFTKLPQVAPDFDLRELLEAGAHFGHQVSKWHPKMAEYIYMAKDGVHIFDLAKTAEQLKKAYNYAYQLGQERKVVIMVGTKRQAKEYIKNSALDAGMLYINSRWLGGLLTNFPQVSLSLKRMEEIEEGLTKGKFDSYTKYERVQLEKEVGRMKRFFEGIRGLKDLPDALFVVDPVREDIVIKEALISEVPVVAMVDSNADPRTVSLAIPANDDAMGSIKLVVEAFAAGYKAGAAKAKQK